MASGLFKQILRWDAVIPGSRCEPKPMVYVEPDLILLEYIQQNKGKQILVSIQNSNSFYDNTSYFAVIDKSANVPSCRPNFYEFTQLYVITLDTPWMGYPENNGNLLLYLS